MSEMIERVALTLKRALGAALDATPLPQPRPNPSDWSATGGVIDLEDVARTVITAMREPTHAMRWCHEMPHIGPDEIAELWRAMIDAALADTPHTT